MMAKKYLLTNKIEDLDKKGRLTGKYHYEYDTWEYIGVTEFDGNKRIIFKNRNENFRVIMYETFLGCLTIGYVENENTISFLSEITIPEEIVIGESRKISLKDAYINLERIK